MGRIKTISAFPSSHYKRLCISCCVTLKLSDPIEYHLEYAVQQKPKVVVDKSVLNQAERHWMHHSLNAAKRLSFPPHSVVHWFITFICFIALFYKLHAPWLAHYRSLLKCVFVYLCLMNIHLCNEYSSHRNWENILNIYCIYIYIYIYFFTKAIWNLLKLCYAIHFISPCIGIK